MSKSQRVDLLILKDDHTDFCVRLVKKGQPYGMDWCLTHEEDRPLVEFYDMRFDHCILGQFVSRYYADTLLEGERGLCLHGGVEAWTVNLPNMARVRNWLRGFEHT